MLTAAAGPSSRSGSLSATVAIPLSNAFYDIRIDFSTSATFTGVHDFAWKDASSWESVPTNRMFALHNDIANAGFSTAGPKAVLSGTTYGPASVLLSPAATCADQNILNGLGISVVTTGSPAVFSVTSRDAYGNAQRSNWNNQLCLSSGMHGDKKRRIMENISTTSAAYWAV